MANPECYTHGFYVGDRVMSLVSKRLATVIGSSASLVSVWWDDCCTPEWYAACGFGLLSNDCGDPPVHPVDRSQELRAACLHDLAAQGLGQTIPVGVPLVQVAALEQRLAGTRAALELCLRRLTAERDRLDTARAREPGLRARVEDLEAKFTAALVTTQTQRGRIQALEAKAAEGLCTWDEIPVGGYYVSPNDGKLRMKLRTESAMAGSTRQFHDLRGADDSGLNDTWGARVGCDPNARIWRRC